MDVLVLQSSPAHKAFKAVLGQANHFLITILVGLEAVRQGIAHVPAEFSTSWNPYDVARSADRSRDFAIRGALAAACDSTDAYLRRLVREPRLLADQALTKDLSDLGRGYLALRLRTAAEFAGSGKSAVGPRHEDEFAIALALSELCVSWRNRLLHSSSEDELSPDVRTTILAFDEAIAAAYRGMSVLEMLDRFDGDARRSPSFKETTAFIRAANIVVTYIDAAVISSMDPDVYLHQWISKFVSRRDDRLVAVWGKDPKNRPKRIAQLAREAGFKPFEEGDHGATLSQATLELMASWSVKDARIGLSTTRG